MVCPMETPHAQSQLVNKFNFRASFLSIKSPPSPPNSPLIPFPFSLHHGRNYHFLSQSFSISPHQNPNIREKPRKFLSESELEITES